MRWVRRNNSRTVPMQIFLRIVIAAMLVSPGGAFAADSPDEWRYQITPYLWLPTIDGSLQYNVPPGAGGSPEISVGPTDWLDLLNFAALISAGAQKGRASVFTDFAYLSMTSKNDGRLLSVDDRTTSPGSRLPIPVTADVNLNTRTDLDALSWTIAGGYQFSSSESADASVFVGARYFGVDVTSSWDLTVDITVPGGGVVLPAQGQVGDDIDLWDGIVGVRGQVGLGEGNWSMQYYLDAGTGDSDLTWNAILGVTYQYGWGDIVLAYRHLEYDQDAGSLLQDFSFSGPGIGARFEF